MTWELYAALEAFIKENSENKAGPVLQLEFDRFAIQRCLWCSGYGHSAEDCITGMKMKQLGSGVQEQVAMVRTLREEARKKLPMADQTKFSRLSGNPHKLSRPFYNSAYDRRSKNS